jgi:hypothetical protein
MEDLRKRRVWRVAVRYLLTAIAILISLGVVEAMLGLPEWTIRMVAGAAFVAMPFVIVLTWALEDPGPENLKAVRRR